MEGASGIAQVNSSTSFLSNALIDEDERLFVKNLNISWKETFSQAERNRKENILLQRRWSSRTNKRTNRFNVYLTLRSTFNKERFV